MPELSLSISLSTFLILIAALFSVALSVLVYRITIPAIPNRIRLLLIALRSLALFFLFLLIAEPLVSLFQRTDEPPQTLVLVDNSRSMTITDKSGVRSEELRSVLNSDAIQQLPEVGDVRFAAFDTRTQFFSSFSYDSLTFTGDGTNLSQALKHVKEESQRSNIRSIVIISDGNSTSGFSPLFEAEDLRIPIFALGIGDTTEQRDLVVHTVLTNALTYAGTRVPVNVTLKSSGFDGQRVEIMLRDSTGVIDHQFVTLQSGEREYSIALSFTPQHPGLQKYRVIVSSLPEELTDQNNRATFFTKVLKSKMRTAILAGEPTTDLSFIRRALEQDPNIEVTAFIEQRGGGVRPGPLTAQALKEQDCLILIGFPRTDSSPAILSTVADAVKNGLPFLFLASRQLDVTRLGPLDPVLPLTIQKNLANEVQTFLQVPETQKRHVVFRLKSPTDDPWSSLPPVFQLQHDLRVKPEGQVLAFSRIQNVATNIQSIAVRNTAGQKSLAVMTYGLWRWKMLSDKRQKDLLDEFMSNSVRWLTTRDDDRKIKIAPSFEFFSSRDPVGFIGQVYDDSFQPIDDAHVTVSIQDRRQKRDLTLSSLGNGQYAGQWDDLPEGDYSFSAIVQRDEVTLGSETGSFSVGDLAIEFLETQAHPLLLRQLAAQTGGSYFERSQRDRLPDAVRSTPGFRSREIVRSSEIELWNAQWSMILLLAVFAAEWLVRKRFAMV